MAVDYDDDSRPSFAGTAATTHKVAAQRGEGLGWMGGGRGGPGGWGRHYGNSKSSVLRTTSARSMQIKWNVRKAQAAKSSHDFGNGWSVQVRLEDWGFWRGELGKKGSIRGIVTVATCRSGCSRAQVQPAFSLYIVRSFSCASFSHSSHSIHLRCCQAPTKIRCTMKGVPLKWFKSLYCV